MSMISSSNEKSFCINSSFCTSAPEKPQGLELERGFELQLQRLVIVMPRQPAKRHFAERQMAQNSVLRLPLLQIDNGTYYHVRYLSTWLYK
jgi:hypothetical protein